jgi:uncharacterized membrane protein HdeD (DUF308 family)
MVFLALLHRFGKSEREIGGMAFFSAIISILAGIAVIVSPLIATVVIASFYGQH